MKSKSKRIISFFLAILTILETVVSVPTEVNAVCVNYFVEITSESAPIRAEPYKESKKVDEVYKGDILLVKNECVNSHGNRWLYCSDKGWIFSDHVTIHSSHKAIMCGNPIVSYRMADDQHEKITTFFDLCKCGAHLNESVSSSFENHKYDSAGKCCCGFAYNRVFTELNAYALLKEDCSRFSEPTKHGKNVGSLLAGQQVHIIGKALNEFGNTWFKLDDNSYLYEGHIDHIHSGVNCGHGWNEYQQNSEDTHITFRNNGGEYCSCGFQVAENSVVTQIEEKHDYDSLSFCSKCGYRKETAEGTVDYENTEISSTGGTMSEYTESEIYSDEFDEEKVATEKRDSEDFFTCVDYEDCTADDSKIYIVTKDDCPIRESPGLFGKIVSKAKKGQLISVKKVSWYLRALSRWAELNVTGSNKKYYVHVGNIDLHESHNFTNALTTNKGTVDFCSVCGVGKATLQDQSTYCDLTCVLDQAVKGSFSKEQTSFISIIAQIIVGEIPGLGTLADCRDLLGDIMNGEPAWVIAVDFTIGGYVEVY